MAEHQLKTWTPFFEEVRSGRKSFELRRNDRGFEVGDVLELQEYEPALGHTGRSCHKVVTYVFRAEDCPETGSFGLRSGFAILGLAEFLDANAVRASEGPRRVDAALRSEVVAIVHDTVRRRQLGPR